MGKKTIIIEKDGKIEYDQFDAESRKKVKGMLHLCGYCDNAYADSCKKVYDISKYRIDKYDFISEGYQIIDDGYLSTFVVSKCDNYCFTKSGKDPYANSARRRSGKISR